MNIFLDRKIKSGYVFPMILLATLSVAFFIITLYQLESSHRTQLMHVNTYQHSLNVAYSVCVAQIAKVKEAQWDSRFFKNKPFIEVNKKLFNSTYDVCVEDYNTASFTFNIKIRTTSAGKSNLFYWRQKYVPNMLDFTRLTIPIFFDDFEPELFEVTKKSEIDKIVDEKIENFAKNQNTAKKINEKVINSSNPGEALAKIGAVSSDNAAQVLDNALPRAPVVALTIKGSDFEKIELDSIMNSISGVIDNVDYIKFPALGNLSYDSGLNTNVRSEPWGSVIAKLPAGATGINVIGMRGDFFELNFNGIHGYSHINFIAVPGHIPSNEHPPMPPGVK